MLTKVSKLKDFGIFSDFKWNTSLNDFKKNNLIYGWNYSGKTTFSKLFTNLEKKQNIDFPKSEYSVCISEDNKVFNNENLNDFPYGLKVFNSKYIQSVFSWGKHEEGFEPISFYLGDKAGDVDGKIKRWEVLSTKVNNRKEKHQKVISIFDDYNKQNGKFSSKSSEIRKNYLDDKIQSSKFNKSDFERIAEEIKGNPKDTLIEEDDVVGVKEQALLDNDFDVHNITLNIVEELSSIAGKVRDVLKDVAPVSVSFPELDEDNVLFKWVQDGVGLHEDNEKCKFCESDLLPTRMTDLNKYYSEKLKAIQVLVANIRSDIELEKEKLELTLPHESKVVNHLKEKYSTSVGEYNEVKAKYLDALDIFEGDLKKREQDYFISINSSAFQVVSLSGCLGNIEAILGEHDEFIDQFDERKKAALDKILNHYAADYLISENYYSKYEDKELSIEELVICERKDKVINSRIGTLKAKLKDIAKGQKELNEYIDIFLNRDDIQIEINEGKYFLKRHGKYAKGLSEGEKMAISFAYFLTELKSLKEEDKLKDTIIFIDDPISSLDSNHIFQVRSLLQRVFSSKDDYLQLFVSTHNFEFFSVLLDSNLFKNLNRHHTKEEKMPFFLINRVSNNNSVIKNLPKSLRKYKSEYAYIFNILKEYSEREDKETFEHAILLPNAFRRFLELYTLMRFPSGEDGIDKRIEKVFGFDKGIPHNTKLYHWFSHQNQFEKVQQHDPKILSIDDAISGVMRYIEENDPMHWEGLVPV